MGLSLRQNRPGVRMLLWGTPTGPAAIFVLGVEAQVLGALLLALHLALLHFCEGTPLALSGLRAW